MVERWTKIVADDHDNPRIYFFQTNGRGTRSPFFEQAI
jgi:hypothetical protein